MPFNSSQAINLTYRGEGLAAGTYRAQLCLFADYSYGKPRNYMEIIQGGTLLAFHAGELDDFSRLL